MAAVVPRPQAAVTEALFPLCRSWLGDRPPSRGWRGTMLGDGESSTMQKVTLGRDATELVRDNVTGVLLQAQEGSRGSRNP